MSEKSTKPAEKAIKNTPPIDTRKGRLYGLLFFALSLFLFVSFVSYFFTWKDDQDIVLSEKWNLFFKAVRVKNITGRYGALFSHGLFYKSFGASCIVLCAPLFALGVNKLFQKRFFQVGKIFFHSLVGAFYFSIFFGLFFSTSNFPLAGAVGLNLAASIQNSLGIVGAILMLLGVPLIYAVWIYNINFTLPSKDALPNFTLFSRIKNLSLFTKKTKIEDTEIGFDDIVIPDIPTKPTQEQPVIVEEEKETDEFESTPPSAQEYVMSAATFQPLPQPQKKQTTMHFEIVEPATDPIIHAPLNPALQLEQDVVPTLANPYANSINGLYKPLYTKTINEQYGEDTITVFPHSDLPATEQKDLLTPVKEEMIELNSEVHELMITSVEKPKPNQYVTFEIDISAEQEILLEQQENQEKNFHQQQDADTNSLAEKSVLHIQPPLQQISFVPILSAPQTEHNENTTSHKSFADPTLSLPNFIMPSAKTSELLETYDNESIVADKVELEKNKDQIVTTLSNYDIAISSIKATIGPTVTLYEIIPAAGIRISKIKNLEDDIALSLAALGIRIIAPIPGKGTIGIEVPNTKKSIVTMKNLVSSEEFKNTKFSLPIALGKTIDNKNYIVDLATMPHLLMAGATGQGKSVGINTILVSLLWKKHPSQLKFVMIDPKKVELSIYKTIEKHYLAKLPNEEDAIITDTKKVVYTINALCIEMDNRYDLLKNAGARNIKEYNEKILNNKLNPEQGHQYLPFIVLVIDEFADLIMTAGKEVEMPIARLAQLARAIGIHLIIATQRPSVNIITGIIKANFPVRIAFKVSSKIDSRTILDAGGADQLIGKGDMLISHNGDITRLQCAFVDTPEVERIVHFIGTQEGYDNAFLLPEYIDPKEAENGSVEFEPADQDANFEEAARLIIQKQLASTSLIQRHLKLGYNRAGRIMDQLEYLGIVGPAQGSKPRELKIKTEAELNQLLSNRM